MRIAHIVPTYLPATRYGGPIYSVHGLCRALAEIGHDVHVFTTSVDGPRDSDVMHGVPVDMDGVKVWYFRSRVLRRLYFAPGLRSAFSEQLSRFDVVHLHSVYLWPTNAVARMCVQHGTPYVLSPRGMLVPELIAQRNRLIKRAWLRLIETKTIEHAAFMHYTSSRERSEALRVFPALRTPDCVVPNGVDAPARPPALSPKLREVTAGQPYCLFLGRIHWVKGIDRLLRSVAGTQVRVLLCGNDEEGYSAEVRKLISALGLERQVIQIAPAYGEDKWALLASARMLVLPSISENFGNVVPEAMAMSCPAITTRGVGAAEIVERSGAGLVCDADDGELRAALLQLWGDDRLRERMATRARAYVDDHLRWPSVARDMTDCYAHALRKPVG